MTKKMTKTKKTRTWISWLKIFIVIASLFLFFLGFLFGYYFTDKGCLENPFTYGAKKFNELNGGSLVCECVTSSNGAESFYFNEKEMRIGPFFGNQA